MMKTPRKRFFQNPNRNAKAKKTSGGFTIVELIIVIVIVSIVAAIAVPSIAAFIRHGQQVNRMNIARTLYLAAQGELTAMRLDGTLVDFGRRVDSLDDSRLSNKLSEDDLENPLELPFIHFVTTANQNSGELVMRLLQNVVLDRVILEEARDATRNGAIVIEFNIETGVVLSVFYSDLVRQLEYEVDGEAPEEEANISGSRNPYTHYRTRLQGHFGVSSTGNLPEMPPIEVARIFDGERRALNDGANHRVNALYAEFLIANPQIGTHTFELFNTGTIYTTGPMTITPGTLFPDPIPENPIRSDGSLLAPIGARGVYYAGIDTESGFHRYVWVIDYVGGNLFDDQPHSVIDKRSDFAGGDMHTLRARVIGPIGEIARSPMSAHTDFAREMPESSDDFGSFEIRSARHLHNIRFNTTHTSADTRYTQTADIDMRYGNNNDIINEITNFRPITPFDGEYIAMRGVENANSQFIIQNLRIIIENAAVEIDPDDEEDENEYPEPPEAIGNVGLFGQLGNQAFIQGIALFNAEIYVDADVQNDINVGAIAGELLGGRITQSWSYANVTGGSTADSSTGGLVGAIGTGGRLDLSFNAGFFNHRSEAPLATPSISPPNAGFVNAGQGYVGGLVGTNEGLILGSFNNARVNIDIANYIDGVSQIPIETESDDINPPGGIAGINYGTISNSYATNLVGWLGGSRGYGIAALGTGGDFINNFFIGNGLGGIDQTQVPNATLAAESPTVHRLPSSIFVSNDVPHVPGENRYFEDGEYFYPYPIIRNNNPFERIYALHIERLEREEPGLEWGWEDVLGAAGASNIIYYEKYNDNTWGFQYGSRQEQDELERWELGRATYKWVVNDGYSIELDRVPGGYTIVIEGYPQDRVFRIPETSENPESSWMVHEDGEDIHSDDWLAPVEIPSATGVDNAGWWRFFIPNALLEEVWDELQEADGGNPTVTIRVYNGLDPELGNDAHLVDEEPVEINPLFAPSDDTLIIRSPRHIHNIGRRAVLLGESYRQDLNIDFEGYRTELARDGVNVVLDDESELPIVYAAVEGTFTGTFDGDRRWIRNLTIDASNADNVGLFSEVGVVGNTRENVQNVTMRNASITGDGNVGTIAGTNRGTITNVSVQQSVAYGRSGSNVGGVVGTNEENAELTNATVVSTSDRPVARPVSGATGVTLGGMIGQNNGNADYLMFLAVAPGTPGTTHMTSVSPFAGVGDVGNNRAYLSGNRPHRPWYYTFPLEDAQRGSYNYMEINPLNEAGNTLETVRRFNENSWTTWGINTLPDPLVSDMTNRTFPYPFPNGTAPPEPLNWPLVITFDITVDDGLIYFERYHDGTYGIFTRRLDPSSPTGFAVVDMLNYNGIVVEAGYAVNLPPQDGAFANAGATRNVHFSFNNGNTWVSRSGFNFGDNRIPVQDLTLRIFKIPMDWLITMGGHSDYADRSQPFLVNMPFTSAAHIADTLRTRIIDGVTYRDGTAFYINPFLAKAVYPTPYPAHAGSNTVAVFQPLAHRQYLHSIRTPWQMQQGVTRAIEAPEEYQTQRHTFVLEGNLNFGSDFVHTDERNDGTTAIITTTTSNIISGDLVGTFRGGILEEYRQDGYRSAIRTISNLNLTNTQNNKGLFHTIGTGGEVHDLVINNFTIQNGSSNAIVAYTNYGTISNIAIRNSAVSSGVSVGGVVNENNLNSTISNVILENTTITATGTNGSAGGIAATNSGTINNAYIMTENLNSTVTGVGTGLAGGVVANNNSTGTIQNTMFISNAPIPVSGNQGNAAGIAGSNAGTIDSVIYMAQAPGTNQIFPIATNNAGTVENTFYLSGTHSLQPGHDSVNTTAFDNINNNANFNQPEQVSGDIGQPATTHELNRMEFAFAGDPPSAFEINGATAGIWHRNINLIYDTLQRANHNPYPFMTNNLEVTRPGPRTWPIATNQAIRLVYFEDYTVAGGGSLPRGYRTGDLGNNVLSTLNNNQDVTIVRTGYGVIVPEPYGDHTLYTVRVGANRAVIGRDSIHPLPDSNMYYFEIPSEIIYGNDSEIRVIVNDIPTRENEVFFRNFAGAIFAPTQIPGSLEHPFIIRTPEQMLSMRMLPSSHFRLERNLDFTPHPLNTPVVTSDFTGTFDGQGHMISNLQITSSSPYVGLFGTIGESGRVGNFTLDFGESGFITATGEGARVGAVAGTNSGAISNIAVVSASTADTAPIQATLTSGIAGGIAGENTASGTITGVLYLARAPWNASGIFPIVQIYSADSAYITNVHYLAELHARIATVPGVGVATMLNFNTADPPPTAPDFGTPFNLDTIAQVTSALETTDSIWIAPTGLYPYPTLGSGIRPPAWPVRGDPSGRALLEEPIDQCECSCECGCEDCEDCDYCEYCELCEYCKSQEVTPPDCGYEDCEPGNCTHESNENNAGEDTNNNPPTDSVKPEEPFDPDNPDNQNPEDPTEPETAKEPEE